MSKSTKPATDALRLVVPEGPLERRLVSDPDWQEGARWGQPRPGHPEGQVARHVAEVLANVEQVARDADERSRLRLIALVHDSFKHQVDTSRPRVGDNHHALLARRFAERYSDDQDLLEVVELHDEAYNAWSQGARRGDWGAGTARAAKLIARLGPALDLYLRFFAADNATGDKERAPLEWFAALAGREAPRLSGDLRDMGADTSSTLSL